jgi:hypothetical protein
VNCATQTLTLTPCPVGIDTTSGAGYQVYINDASAEAVDVTGGTCTSGAGSGTITFVPFASHTSYTVGSASSGIQETINADCGVDPFYSKNTQCNVTIPSNGPGYPAHLYNTYNIYGTTFLHSTQSVLSAYGASLNCYTRGPCLKVGDAIRSSHYTDITVSGIAFRTPLDLPGVLTASYAGSKITNTQRIAQVVTVTTAAAHGFRPGDLVTILFTDNSIYWGDAVITSVPTSTTFTYTHLGKDLAAQTTPGLVALAYVAILDNAQSTHFIDITDDYVGNLALFNNFFDMWDDENATIEHFNNNGINLNASAVWTGSFIYSGGAGGHGTAQNAPVITLRDSTITANYSNGATVYNSNGIYIEDTVIQAQGLCM